MEYFFIIGGLIIGTIFVTIGFKIINPFKEKNESEKEWYNKFGRKMKIIGIMLIIFSGIQIGLKSIGEKVNPTWKQEDKNKMTESCFQYAKQNVNNPKIAQDYCECTT